MPEQPGPHGPHGGAPQQPYGPPGGPGGHGPPARPGGYGPPAGNGPGAYGPPGGRAAYGPPAAPGAYGPPAGHGQYGPPPQPGPGHPAPGDAPWRRTAAPQGAPQPPPPPLRKKKGKGGRIALIVIAVVLVVLVGGGYLAYRALNDFVSDVTGGGSLAGAGAGCSFVSAEDVNATLGGTYEMVELGGLGGIAGVALDSRVLPEAPTCWGVDESSGKLVRIARHEGADSADVFARERATAEGTSQQLPALGGARGEGGLTLHRGVVHRRRVESPA